MDDKEFLDRTKRLGLRVIKLVEALPKTTTSQVIGQQLLRSATSVGAHYRAACRTKAAADTLNKLKTVEDEADETLYWLELIADAELMPAGRLKDLMAETDQIIAMTAASIKSVRDKQKTQAAKAS